MTTQLHLHGGFLSRGEGKVTNRGISSLKQKRSIVKSVIGKLKARFNVSVAEIDHQDDKTCAVIAMSLVTNDSRFVNQQFDKILDFVRADGRFYLGQVEREIFS